MYGNRNRFEDVQSLLDEIKEDFAKFYEEKNMNAGTRVRKQMQSLKTLAQEIRTEVQDIKNNS